MVLADTYELTRLLGEGGMGAVWEARHRRLKDKRVAIKVLHPIIASDSEAMARFQREAEIACRLGHPNIVDVHDFNTLPDGAAYLVLELLKGESLADRVQRGPIPAAQALSIARQIAAALQAAHQHSIIHRDLKPQNIFLCPTDAGGYAAEQVKVLDFGISKIRGSSTVATQTAAILGTPQYMAPEQATGDNDAIDGRTDIFALGVIAYEMLAGKAAFSGNNIPEVLYKVVYTDPEPLSAQVPQLAGNVLAAIERALAKKPEDRFPNVAEFAEALTGDPLVTLPPQARKRASLPAPQSPSNSPGDGDIAVAATAVSNVHAAVSPPRSQAALAATAMQDISSSSPSSPSPPSVGAESPSPPSLSATEQHHGIAAPPLTPNPIQSADASAPTVMPAPIQSQQAQSHSLPPTSAPHDPSATGRASEPVSAAVTPPTARDSASMEQAGTSPPSHGLVTTERIAPAKPWSHLLAVGTVAAAVAAMVVFILLRQDPTSSESASTAESASTTTTELGQTNAQPPIVQQTPTSPPQVAATTTTTGNGDVDHRDIDPASADNRIAATDSQRGETNEAQTTSKQTQPSTAAKSRATRDRDRTDAIAELPEPVRRDFRLMQQFLQQDSQEVLRIGRRVLGQHDNPRVRALMVRAACQQRDLELANIHWQQIKRPRIRRKLKDYCAKFDIELLR